MYKKRPINKTKVALKTSRQGTISLYIQTSKMYHSGNKADRQTERRTDREKDGKQ